MTAQANPSPKLAHDTPVRVWDLPTRVFHWSLACSFAVAWITSESDRWLALHVFCGYAMAALVAFRLVWGFIGTRYARFAQFAYGPRAAWDYALQVLHRSAPRHLGHNPAGSFAIFCLLGLALIVALSGVFTLGGEEGHGLMAPAFATMGGRWAKGLHEIVANAMMGLVLVHLAGVVVESWLHRENLARSMLTGIKRAAANTPGVARHVTVALALALSLGGLALWWFAYALPVPAGTAVAGVAPASAAAASVSEPVPFKGPALPTSARWNDECGSCHLAFHPSLLPARSWQRLLADTAHHFNNDLGLDTATLDALRTFATANAADRQQTEAAMKIVASLDGAQAPLRITDTPYWMRKHREISKTVWASPKVKSQSNCSACHLDAESATFEDGAMRMPG